jgi:hypothetical protein
MTGKKKTIAALAIIAAVGVCGGIFVVASFVTPNLIPALYENFDYKARRYVSEKDFDRYFKDFEIVANRVMDYTDSLPVGRSESVLSYSSKYPAALSDMDTEQDYDEEFCPPPDSYNAAQ